MKKSEFVVLNRSLKPSRLLLALSISIFTLTPLISCSAQLLLSPRDKSIKEWELHEWRKEEQNSDLSGFLDSDHQKLYNFSKRMGIYGISERDFERLFWRGLNKSLRFYQSSEFLDGSFVNQIIDLGLRTHVSLGHTIKGSEIEKDNITSVFKALNNFSGDWYGQWKNRTMHHLWLPVKTTGLKLTKESRLIGLQSCFTGDGFGWNYLIEKGEEIIILGHVYHFNPQGLGYENPHYGFLNDEGLLTWVSDNHVYYEFVCEDEQCKNGRHYVITAIPYSKDDTLRFDIPIQATYRSRNNNKKISL